MLFRKHLVAVSFFFKTVLYTHIHNTSFSLIEIIQAGTSFQSILLHVQLTYIDISTAQTDLT